MIVLRKFWLEIAAVHSSRTEQIHGKFAPFVPPPGAPILFTLATSPSKQEIHHKLLVFKHFL